MSAAARRQNYVIDHSLMNGRGSSGPPIILYSTRESVQIAGGTGGGGTLAPMAIFTIFIVRVFPWIVNE